MVDKPLFFFCNSTNNNMHYMIKMISFWNLDWVLAFLLDLDVAIGDNINTTDTISISLTKVDRFIDSSIIKIKTNELYADASQGETKDSFITNMNKLGRTIDLELFLVITYSLYGMNLMMCSSYKKCLGNGGISSCNTI